LFYALLFGGFKQFSSFAIVLYQSETAKVNLWMPSHCPVVTESITRLAASANRVPDCRNSTHNLAVFLVALSIEHIGKTPLFHFNGLSGIYRSNRRFLRSRGLPQSQGDLRKGKEA
jgi:hypothetical protein